MCVCSTVVANVGRHHFSNLKCLGHVQDIVDVINDVSLGLTILRLRGISDINNSI